MRNHKKNPCSSYSSLFQSFEKIILRILSWSCRRRSLIFTLSFIKHLRASNFQRRLRTKLRKFRNLQLRNKIFQEKNGFSHFYFRKTDDSWRNNFKPQNLPILTNYQRIHRKKEETLFCECSKHSSLSFCFKKAILNYTILFQEGWSSPG